MNTDGAITRNSRTVNFTFTKSLFVQKKLDIYNYHIAISIQRIGVFINGTIFFPKIYCFGAPLKHKVNIIKELTFTWSEEDLIVPSYDASVPSGRRVVDTNLR